MCPPSTSTNTANINIDSLGQEVRNFAIKYEQGSRQASQLVSSEALQVQEVVVRQSGKTEEAIRAHFTQTSEKFERKFQDQLEQASRQQLRESLLNSLKYPGMNERANQVELAHKRTFRWLFADADGSNCSDDEEPYSSSSADLDSQDMHSGGESTDDFTDSESKEKLKPLEIVWSSLTDWLQSDLGIYWIMGKPGSGKSTLAKFILSEPRTKIMLEKWRPGVKILSHYFWRPGALLQRSIKGLLCSIVYQLVLSFPKALEYASETVSGLEQKDSDTDWSVPELHQLCLGLIRYCGKPLCLLIDGLDECGPEDNQQRLLEILETIRLPNVKIIASSRNEPVFEKQFRHEPQLRVQDLTAGDLNTYAADTLLHDVQDKILGVLVERAEGVFLWLVLAVQSINRGLSNGDSFEDLHKRVISLPRGLNDLYKDMWQRLNDDCDLYRESAALYFKLVIALDGQNVRFAQHGWTCLDMMLASFAKNHNTFAKELAVSASQLLKECEEFQKRVKVRCAGLLGMYREPDLQPLKKPEDTEWALEKFATSWTRFVFIHRSARDFLIDTAEGQNILRHDRTSSEDIKIRIISARLRTIELLDLLVEHQQYFYDLDWRSLQFYLEDLSSVAGARDSAAEARDSAAGKLISRCYELHRSASLTLHKDGTLSGRIATFFETAASYPNLHDYCTPVIENQLVGSNIRSAVLLSVVTTHQGSNTLNLTRQLLSLPDVDVNLKCPLLVSSNDQSWVDPLDHIKESPFSRLLGSGLKQSYWIFDKNLRYRHHFLGLVADFACQGADFRSTLLLAIPLNYLTQNLATRERLVATGRFFQFAKRDICKWYDHYDQTRDGLLCVVALQASTVIQKMLASLPMTKTGYISINERGYRNSEDEFKVSDLGIAIPFLSQRCQEYGGGASDRVIGFLSPSWKRGDMPYRQVSDHDSAQLVEILWACIFKDKSRWKDLGAACREVVTRSPFSSIGFRDYLRDLGYFDELEAQKLLLEYDAGIVTPPSVYAFEVWQ